MKVTNLTAKTDEEFLADSIRCWQEALDRRDFVAFRILGGSLILFCKRTER